MPADLALQLIVREFVNLAGSFGKVDGATANDALAAAERRIAAHLFSVVELIGDEPEWLIDAASTLRKAIDAAREEINGSLH